MWTHFQNRVGIPGMQAHVDESVLANAYPLFFNRKGEWQILLHWNLHNQSSCWLLHFGQRPYYIFSEVSSIDRIRCLQSVEPKSDMKLQCIPYSIEVSNAVEHSIQETCLLDKQSPNAISIQLNKHPTILGVNSTNARECFLYSEMNGLLRYRLYRLTNQWPSSVSFSQAL